MVDFAQAVCGVTSLRKMIVTLQGRATHHR